MIHTANYDNGIRTSQFLLTTTKVLIMTIYINAWIDNSHPHISLTNRNTGETLAYFTPSEVEKLLTDGDITVEELRSNDTAIQQDLVKELFLIKAIQDIEQQVYALPKILNKRSPKHLMPTIKNVITSIQTLSLPTIAIFPSHTKDSRVNNLRNLTCLFAPD